MGCLLFIAGVIGFGLLVSGLSTILSIPASDRDMFFAMGIMGNHVQKVITGVIILGMVIILTIWKKR